MESGMSAATFAQVPLFAGFGAQERDGLAHCASARCPGAALQVIRYLTQPLRGLTNNVRSLALLDVYGRVARMLLSLAEPQGDKLVIKQRITQQKVANLVGSAREMVTRILKDLANGGYIDITDRTITLKQCLPTAW